MGPAADPDDLDQRNVATPAEAREVVCRMGRLFYRLGWATGTGGGLSVRLGARAFMAPSGVQKERLRHADIFEVDLEDGAVRDGPPPERGLRVSQCRPLFLHAYRLRRAGAVLHSHSMHAMLATLLCDDAVRISRLEMLKGIAGVGYEDEHVVPIIDNTPHESDLADALAAAIERADSRCHAVLVRRHGVYVWGDDWIAAKRHAECYDYLFQAVVEMRRLGIG